MSLAKNIGLFGENVGLFWENVGLFWENVRLFWEICAYWPALMPPANQSSNPVKWHGTRNKAIFMFLGLTCRIRMRHVDHETRNMTLMNILCWICVTLVIRMCDMTHSYVFRGRLAAFVWSKSTTKHTIRLFWIYSVEYVWHSLFKCVTWLIHMCFAVDLTTKRVMWLCWICVTLILHVCDLTYSCVWLDLFICVTWHVHRCGAHQNTTASHS